MKYIFLLIFIFNCKNQPKQPEKVVEAVPEKRDTVQQRAEPPMSDEERYAKETALIDSLVKVGKIRPVKGPRMKVTGDFNGDGKNDTLYERYISLLTGKETNKEYDFDEDIDGMDALFFHQNLAFRKKPLVRLKSNDPAIKNFDVASGGAQGGFDYLKNIGDLNGNGTDELVFYIYSVDMSSLNSCALATYKNGKWKQIKSWVISETDFYHKINEPKPQPIYVKKKGEKVYYREYDLGEYVWKRLKTNW